MLFVNNLFVFPQLVNKLAGTEVLYATDNSAPLFLLVSSVLKSATTHIIKVDDYKQIVEISGGILANRINRIVNYKLVFKAGYISFDVQ